MSIRSTDYGNNYIANKAIGKVLSELVGTKQYPKSIQNGVKLIRCKGDPILLKAFKSVLFDIENQASKGKISESQSQIIMFEIFAGFSREANYNYALNLHTKCVPNDVGPIKKILELYKASNLSEPYRIRDTDGDGLLDPDEITQDSDIYTNERIHGAERRKARKRGEELRKAIQDPRHSKPNQGRKTYMTYVGDLGIRYGKRNDGYIFFKPKKVKNATLEYFKIPHLLRLDNRRVTTEVKVSGGPAARGKTVLLIKRKQGQELAAIIHSKSKLNFYIKSSKGPAEYIIRVGRTHYAPFENIVDKGLIDLAIAYQEAYATVNTGEARISPYEWNNRVRNFNENRRIATKAILIRLNRATKEKIEKHSKQIQKEKENLKDWAEIFSSEFTLIAVAVHNGILKIDIDSTGKLNLELQKGKLRPEDFRKIRSKFEKHVINFSIALNRTFPILNQAIAKLNSAGKAYYKYANSNDFKTYLKMLSPEERAEQMGKVAEVLLGTEAGEQLSEDLWNAVHYRKNKKYNLAELMVNEPTPRSLITSLYLSVVAQVAVISVKLKPEEDNHFFYFRLVTGRNVDSGERKFIKRLIKVKRMAEEKYVKSNKQKVKNFTKLMNKVLKHEFINNSGPASHVLHAYGHLVHHAQMVSIIARNAQRGTSYITSYISLGEQLKALKQLRPSILQPNSQSPPSWKHRGVMIGATGFATFSFVLSINHVIHRPKLYNIIHMFVEGVNTSAMFIGAIESWRPFNNKWVKRIGKYGGPAVALVHVVVDGFNVHGKVSPEGKKRARIQLAGSIAIGIGSTWLASNPVGWIIAAGGLIAKIAGGNTDPKYEFAYKELKKLSVYKEF